MHAPAYHCPACGGPQQHSGPGRCDFCGSVRVPLGTPDPRLARPCPECAALVAADHQFCPRCGAAQGDTDPPLDDSDLRCPGCEHTLAIWPLQPQLLGNSSYRGVDPQIQGCQQCGGAWVDRRTLDAIIAEARAQASNVDARAVPRKTMAMAEVVFYRPCPRCGERMNRRNFGRYSGVVVDECSCGTYFDAGELEGVVAFVRGGGLTVAERRNADEARRDLAHRRQMTAAPIPSSSTTSGIAGVTAELEMELLIGFLRWLGRWIRRLRR